MELYHASVAIVTLLSVLSCVCALIPLSPRLELTGGVSRYIKTNDQVFHIEQDIKHYGDHLLYSDGHALLTTDGVQQHFYVAGVASIPGYVEGSTSQARFSYILGFYQMNSSHVLVADNGNDCLRMIDRYRRLTHTFLGVCKSPSYSGDPVNGYNVGFNRPVSLLNYKENGKFLYLVEFGSQSVRIIYLKSRLANTLITSDLLRTARYITQDKDGYIYITTDYAVVKLTVDQAYQKAEASRIAGSASSSYIHDGYFYQTLFARPRGIMAIGNEALIVADATDDGCLRIMNMLDNSTASICSGSLRKSAFHVMCGGQARAECAFYQPYSFLLLGDKLYIGENGTIRTMKARYIQPTTAATYPRSTLITPTPITQVEQSTQCASRNITVHIPQGQRSTRLDIATDQTMTLTEGEYIHEQTSRHGSCVSHISVLNYQKYKCPEAPIIVQSDVHSHLGHVKLTIEDFKMNTRLPVGNYSFDIVADEGKINCAVKVRVLDYRLMHRLDFRASYKVNCSLLQGDVTRTAFDNVVNHNYVQIEEICQNDCGKPADNTDIEKTCKGDVLTVTWPTSLTFSGETTFLPPRLKQNLTERLIQKGSTLSLFVMSSIPPVVYPVPLANGASAEVMLKSYCLNGLLYNSAIDSCE